MITSRQQLVVPDSGGGLTVPTFDITFNEGSDVEMLFSVVHADGTAYNLSGNVNAVMAFRASPGGPILLQRSWTITNATAGYVKFDLVRGDRAYLGASGPTQGKYYYGIQFLDSDTGYEDAIMSPSVVTVLAEMGDFSYSVSVLPSQTIQYVPDPSSATEGSVLVAHSGAYSLSTLAIQYTSVTFDGTQDYKDASWTTAFTTYQVAPGVLVTDGESPVTVNLYNKASTSIRVVPTARFSGTVYLLIYGVP